jgi:hypothetical protein
MVGAGRQAQAAGRTDETFAGLVFHLGAGQPVAEVVVGRDVDHARLRAEGDGWPVLAAPVRRADVIHLLAGRRLARRVDIGTSGLRIQAAEYVLLDIGHPLDEADRTGAALEEPQVAVASHIDEPLHGAAAALVVDQDWR